MTDTFDRGVMWDTPNRELSVVGRWLSPDPAGVGWNQYAYPTNPNSSIDPTGLYCVYLNNTGGNVESIDTASNSGECGDNTGYWIEGEYGSESWISINVDNGTVTGLGYDPRGNPEVSIAGAQDSNAWGAWGAWTQTFNSPAVIDIFQRLHSGTNSAANNGTWQWTKTSVKSLVQGPSTGPGSCVGLFTDTVTAPLKQIQSAAKNYVPLIVGAMQAGPSGAAMYMQQLNNMVASGAAEADPQVAAVVTTAGAAAATAAPYVTAAAPYVVPVGGDALLLNGVIKEVQAGMSGQCTW
jgi:hypothetical protein